MKLPNPAALFLIALTVSVLVTMATARRGSRKGKKKDGSSEPPSWKANSNPSQRVADVTKKAGSKVTLKCAADGNPKPKIRWTKDGAPIKKPTSGRIKEKKYNLLMSDLETRDSGNYTCELSNKHGSIQWTYNLVVLKVIWPLEIEGPKNQTVYEGENVTLSCRVTNDPRAQIQWLRRKHGNKFNSTIMISEEQMFMPQKTNSELLILHNVTVDDSGLYKCLAGNFDGLKYSDAWLTVLPRDSHSKAPATTDYSEERKTTLITKPVQEATTTRAVTMGPKTAFTKPPTKPTKGPRKKGSKDRKFPGTTERPRLRKPKPSPREKDKGNGGRSKGNRRKNTPFYPMFTTEATKSWPPKRTDVVKAKKEDPIFVAPNSDNPGVYNSSPPEKGENPSDNSTNMKESQESAAKDEDIRVSSIDLWKVYIIVGAIGGGILLIGLVTLVVAVACGRKQEGQYKSTTV